MICGTLSGPTGLAIGIVAVAGFLVLSFILLRSPKTFLSFSHRYDAWWSSKVRVLKLVWWPRHWLESRLDQLGMAPTIIRAWGLVLGLVGLCLLGGLAITVVRPCP